MWPGPFGQAMAVVIEPGDVRGPVVPGKRVAVAGRPWLRPAPKASEGRGVRSRRPRGDCGLLSGGWLVEEPGAGQAGLDPQGPLDADAADMADLLAVVQVDDVPDGGVQARAGYAGTSPSTAMTPGPAPGAPWAYATTTGRCRRTARKRRA
jgi:hypothetical protein